MRACLWCWLVFFEYSGAILNCEFWILALRRIGRGVCVFICMCVLLFFSMRLRLVVAFASFCSISVVFVPPGPTLKARLCRHDRNSCNVASFAFLFCRRAFALSFFRYSGVHVQSVFLLSWCYQVVCILDSYRLHKPLARKSWLTVYRAHQRCRWWHLTRGKITKVEPDWNPRQRFLIWRLLGCM